MIILYTTKTCAGCQQIKDWLDEKGLEWEAGNNDEIFEKTGSTGVPTLVWGEEIITGYAPKRLEELYGSQKEEAPAPPKEEV